MGVIFFGSKNIQRGIAYAKLFVNNRITESYSLTSPNTQHLLKPINAACIKTYWDIGCCKFVRFYNNIDNDSWAVTKPLPQQINQDMTSHRYLKFLSTETYVFKQATSTIDTQVAAQLYSCCDDVVQNCQYWFHQIMIKVQTPIPWAIWWTNQLPDIKYNIP